MSSLIRPKGMPRNEWRELSDKQKTKAIKTFKPVERFLDVQVTTNNHNSGVQQYGAGQSIRSRDARHRARDGVSHSVPNTSLGSRTIQDFSEVVMSVYSVSVVFDAVSHIFQPGLASAFPWLSGIAQRYQRYRVLFCRYRFVPDVSVFNSDAGTQGRVCMAFDYNPIAQMPASMQIMMDTKPNVVGMPKDSLSFDLNPNGLTPIAKKTRSGPVAGDYNTYDGGILYFGVEGTTNVTIIGEVFVDYTVEFYDPQLTDTLPPPVPTVYTRKCIGTPTSSASGVTIVAGADAAYPWSVLAGVDPRNVGTLDISFLSTGHFVVPRGNYRISFQGYVAPLTGGASITASTWSTYSSEVSGNLAAQTNAGDGTANASVSAFGDIFISVLGSTAEIWFGVQTYTTAGNWNYVPRVMFELI